VLPIQAFEAVPPPWLECQSGRPSADRPPPVIGSFPLADYPRIKCNIARRTDERIYHLPFDQQYDSTVVEPTRGECYVATAREAEVLGFRRAWRWHGPQAEAS
jgi:hypothetical protein